MQEFAKMHAIMQQANADTLAAFYAGSLLTYESSMGMRVATDLFGKATTKVRGKIDQSDTSIPPKLEALLSRIVAKVAKAESQYVIDTLGAYAASQVASQIKDQISGAAMKGIPVVGLIKAGLDALLADASAIDLIVRRAAAARHANELKVGPPREAALAVKKILTRKAAIESAAAASSSAAFGAGVAIEVSSMGAASAAGLETGVAISQAIIEVIAMVVEMVMDSLECHRGNEMLANHADVVNFGPTTLKDMFNKCPLLGGYMLATPLIPTSAFVWLITKEYNVSSVEEVSRVAIDHVNPLRTEGSWVVCESPFELRNPTNETSDKAMREARLRNEVLNKSFTDKMIDQLTQDSYETPEAYKGFGMDNGTPTGPHTISRKAGILNKPATRFRAFKKTASQKIASTRVGAYFKKLS
jgi:hypothetical protein